MQCHSGHATFLDSHINTLPTRPLLIHSISQEDSTPPNRIPLSRFLCPGYPASHRPGREHDDRDLAGGSGPRSGSTPKTFPATARRWRPTASPGS